MQTIEIGDTITGRDVTMGDTVTGTVLTILPSGNEADTRYRIAVDGQSYSDGNQRHAIVYAESGPTCRMRETPHHDEPQP